MRGTLIGPSKPFKLPRRNLVQTAIQKFTLRPKRVLKITLKHVSSNCCLPKYLKICGKKKLSNIYIVVSSSSKHLVTNTALVPRMMTGFRPYRSAITPQKTDVNARPSMNAEPSRQRSIRNDLNTDA